MNILHVTHSLAPKAGGTVEIIMQSTKIMLDQGHQVELACFDGPNEPHIQTCPYRIHTFKSKIKSYGWTVEYIFWLKQHAKDFDIVLVHGLWLFPTFGTYLGLRATKCPYFVFSHGMLDPWFNKKYPIKKLKKLVYWLLFERRVLCSALAVLFTCQQELILAKNSFPFSNYQSQVVPFGTTSPRENLAKSAEVFKSAFPECRNTKNLIFMGRLHPKKGCDLLIKAFAKIYGQEPETRLIMVGPDSVGWRAELEELAIKLNIQQQITWTGLLNGELKIGAYASSEVFILPSHQENFGIVVAEAMACGLPVLLSDQVNIFDVILRENAGFVEKDDEQGCLRLLANWRAMSQTDKEKMAEVLFEKFGF